MRVAFPHRAPLSRGVLLAIALLLPSVALPSESDIERGDAAWANRADRLDGRLAVPSLIQEAIDAYRAALDADPESLEARWKTLRSLHYSVEFTPLEESEKDARVGALVALARSSIDRIEGAGAETSVDRDFDVARVRFWSAIAWGARAQRAGLLTIVREGVANRIRESAMASLELDETVDEGGALRLLSRLHATLPRVPFLSGWVDRDRALELAERSMALAPDHPGNRLILALALLERAPERAGEARSLLEGVITADPRPDYVAEDLAIQEQAREVFERATASG